MHVCPAGRRNCFHSIAEVAACLDAQARSAGLRTVYIATNADVREQAMLREGISSAVVLFWQDVEGLLGGSSNGGLHGLSWSDWAGTCCTTMMQLLAGCCDVQGVTVECCMQWDT
jgi:hypothetical protein